LPISVLEQFKTALAGRSRRLSVGGYARHKARVAARQRQIAAEAQDIGEIPAVVNADRKARAAADFQFFCTTYLAPVFYMEWSADHLRAIGKIERAVREGDLFAHAMPRGSGKTVLAEAACLWSVLIGARPFCCLVAASAERAVELLAVLKTWLETNDLLLEDWPEVVYPIRKLGRIVNRQKGQTYKGEATRIEWNTDRVVLPIIPGSAASGSVITTAGLKASDIRGQHHALPDGRVLRPSLALIDDPQTTESAWSVSQSYRRERVLAGDVLGMAGPGQKIAAIMCCTVIRPGDMADSILNRDKHPEWQGERTKMMYSFPADEKLWDEYAKLRAESLKAGHKGEEATDFYRLHRADMDRGACIAWPARHNDDELSAIQHAMNLKLRDEAAFFAEYQNEPLVDDQGIEEMLSADQIAAKTSGLARGEVPVGCTQLTAFIDVQKELLFYVVVAWRSDFTGYVVDYGAYPDQDRAFFSLRDARNTLSRVSPRADLGGAIRAGLDALADRLMGREWERDDGAVMRIGRCLVDANWGKSTDTVYHFCRESVYAPILVPSHGRGVTASNIPFADYRRKAGDEVGHNWRIPNVRGKKMPRHVMYDTNYWKTFVHERLAVAKGDGGCLSLWGRKADQHRLFAEHLTAEVPIKTQGRGRRVDEWKPRAGAFDNHWLDCLVGCAVAASMCGVALPGMDQTVARDRRLRKAIRLSDLQRNRR